MARRDFGPATRRTTARPRRGGNLFTGLLAGLLLGILVAAAVAWFITRDQDEAKVEQIDEVLPPPKPASGKAPSVKPPTTPVKSPPPAPKVNIRPEPAKAATQTPKKPPAEPAPAAPVRALPPPIGYDYGSILGEDKPLKPRPPARPQEQWWLQVAALKNENDARRLRAKLLLLNLDAVVQRAEVGNVLLYRVRVGPFNSEEASYTSLEILSQNNYTPRALKETVLP